MVVLDYCSITNICDAVASNPSEASASCAVLVAALEEQEFKSGDARNITQDNLKVLTIMNEMLQDRYIVSLLRNVPRFEANLQRLRQFKKGSMGEVTDENIRILATEIEKTVFGCEFEPKPKTEVIAFCPAGHLLSYSKKRRKSFLRGCRCILCGGELPRTVESHSCRACNYNVCVACVYQSMVPTQNSLSEL